MKSRTTGTGDANNPAADNELADSMQMGQVESSNDILLNSAKQFYQSLHDGVQAAQKVMSTLAEEQSQVDDLLQHFEKFVEKREVVEQYWSDHFDILRRSPEVVERYGIYQKFILHNTKVGDRYLRDAKSLLEKQKAQSAQLSQMDVKTAAEQMVNNPNPFLILKHENNSVIIEQCNQSFCSLLRFRKMEIIDKSSLMCDKGLRPIILDQQYVTIEALMESKDKENLNHSKLSLFFVDRNGAMIETECSMQFKLHTGVSMLLLRIEPVPVKSLVSKLAIDPISNAANPNLKTKFPIVQFNSATKTVFGLSKFSPEDEKITDVEALLGNFFAVEIGKLHLDRDFVKNKHKMIGPFKFTRALVEREYQTKVSVAPLSCPKKDDQLNKFIYIVEVWCPEQISQGQMAALLGGGTSQRNISSFRFIDLHETTDNVFSFDLVQKTAVIGLREENTVSQYDPTAKDPQQKPESNLIDIVESSITHTQCWGV